MEVTGFIDFIGERQQVSDTFTKREIWIKQEGDYPQTLNIQFTQDRTDLLDSFKVGQPVVVNINLRGRTWQNPQTGELKCFNTIEGWRIVGEKRQPQVIPPTPSTEVGENDDDLPF